MLTIPPLFLHLLGLTFWCAIDHAGLRLYLHLFILVWRLQTYIILIWDYKPWQQWIFCLYCSTLPDTAEELHPLCLDKFVTPLLTLWQGWHLCRFFSPPFPCLVSSSPSIPSDWAVLLRLKYWSLLRLTLTWQSGLPHTVSSKLDAFPIYQIHNTAFFISHACLNHLLPFYNFKIPVSVSRWQRS